MSAGAASQVAIPAAVISEMNDCMNKASDSITPFSDTLTPEEIKRLAKANNKTYSFLTKALEFCLLNPQYLSHLFTPDEFQGYMDNVNQLIAAEMKAKQLTTLLTTTRMTNAAGAFEVALDFYKAVKAGAKKNVPGAQDMYKELSARFPGKKKKKPEPTAATAETPKVKEAMQAA